MVCQKLGEYAAKTGINVIVENHGGFTSNGQWLAKVMKGVNMKNVGTLPDFGNFCIKRKVAPCGMLNVLKNMIAIKVLPK